MLRPLNPDISEMSALRDRNTSLQGNFRMSLIEIAIALCDDVDGLRFSGPVATVYNPLDYARAPYQEYVERYGSAPKEVLLVGMNPGPWGMAQTGVPFGEINAVRDWMGVCAEVKQPENMHPKRPVDGFDCHRSEVSGRRLWGWAKGRFGAPQTFFKRFFVLNYCPLLFLEETGRNRTPDKLKAEEREILFETCDEALRQSIAALEPDFVVGIGAFAEKRINAALGDLPIQCGRITHPSPANPKANRGWTPVIEQELDALGVKTDR